MFHQPNGLDSVLVSLDSVAKSYTAVLVHLVLPHVVIAVGTKDVVSEHQSVHFYLVGGVDLFLGVELVSFGQILAIKSIGRNSPCLLGHNHSSVVGIKLDTFGDLILD